MINVDDARNLIGTDVRDFEGNKIGSAGQVFLDDQTNQPEWVTVNTGLFGTKESFVPLREASFTGDAITVPYDKSKVKDAPSIDTDSHLSPQEEEQLYTYYGLGFDSAGYDAAQTQTVDFDDRQGTTGYDTSGPTTDSAMTVSEERLDVSTESAEAGRARLKKYVVTENETVTVPVSKERISIEREPITDGNVGSALDGPTFSEEEHEVVLHEERPVVNKEAVPVERVRLDKETVTKNETFSEELQKERVDIEGADGTFSDRGDRI